MAAVDVHPDLRIAHRLLPRSPVSRRTLAVMRTATRLLRGRRGVSQVAIGDGVSVRVHRPARPRDDGAAMLWIHGGGYVFGTPVQDDALCAAFAERVGMTVAAVSYRFAPEHPYPSALDDVHTALRWLRDRPDVDPAATVIAGRARAAG